MTIRQSARGSRRHAAKARRPLAWLLGTLLALPLAAAEWPSAQPPPAPAALVAAIDAGDFAAARHTITTALAEPGLDATRRAALEFQRERMRRIELDFTLDAATLKARLRKLIPDLSAAEFARWDQAGWFERKTIDGAPRYFNRAAGNLFYLSAEARARRAQQGPLSLPDGPMEALNDTHRAIRAAALASGQAFVLPQRVRMTQTLTVDADAVPAGETVRAWIPYPIAVPGQQQDIRYVASEPAAHRIAPEDAPQRTVYFEKPARSGEPTTFLVTYELTLAAQYRELDPAQSVREAITPELAPYVAERAPHVVFTPALREFSARVVGTETNPLRIARKLFAAVDLIPWAGAREYSTISNISDYALHAGHADCGQQTLLLIALLRLNGIPARWQSGMVYAADGSGYANIHDWGFVHLAPWGWVPMDVTTGQLHGDAALRWFYLGGLDHWRIAFNADFGRAFTPAKQHFRSDTVDSQRGEAEWVGGNLYFNQLDYAFDWQLLPAVQGRGDE